MRLVLLALLYIAAAAVASAVETPQPGVWPNLWVAEWTIFDHPGELPEPPYADMPPAPYRAGRGRTYYDYPKQQMLEVYEDFCVPIFSFSVAKCRFLIRDQTAYMTEINEDLTVRNCCIFEKPFHPPAPDFILKNPEIKFNTTNVIAGQTVDWFVLVGPEPAPFGYGFFSPTKTPAAFYFRGAKGWTQQNFEHFRAVSSIPETLFALPPQCNTDKRCPE